jgi:acetyl esterase/lipase
MSSTRSRAARLASTVLPVLLAAPCVDASETNAGRAVAPRVDAAPHAAGSAARRRLRVDDRLGDLLHHPALVPFSRLILPWDARAYDEAMPLKDIAQLLPYHDHVDPGVVVSALNRVIDEASQGRTVFHNIYSDAQRRANPSLQNTGLFHLRGKPGAPFALIAPGGGFSYVGSVHEGFPYASEITQRGFHGFVLKYRVGQGGRAATEDLAAALVFVFAHADELELDSKNYSLWGS